MGHFAKLLLLIIFWSALSASVFIHVVYPIILAVLSMLFRHRAGDRSQGELSVAVLLWDDDPGRARQLLDSLLDASLPKGTEIVLLGAASQLAGDGLPEFVRPIPNTALQGRADALNFAALKSSASVLILPAAGVKLDRYSVRGLLECLRDSGSGCAFALSNSRPHTFHYTSWLAQRMERAGMSNLFVWPGLVAVRRELVRPLGSEDVPEFAIAFDLAASGHRVVSCASAYADLLESEDRAASLAGISQTMIEEARSLFARAKILNPARFGILSVRIWFEKILLWLSPLIVFTAFFANLVIAFFLWIPFYQGLMFAQSVFYLSALAGYRRLGRSRGGPFVTIYRFVHSLFAMALMLQNYSKR